MTALRRSGCSAFLRFLLHVKDCSGNDQKVMDAFFGFDLVDVLEQFLLFGFLHGMPHPFRALRPVRYRVGGLFWVLMLSHLSGAVRACQGKMIPPLYFVFTGEN